MQSSQWLQCPWCGERFELLLDPSAGDAEFTEDCPVCCRPIAMQQQVGEDDEVELRIERE